MSFIKDFKEKSKKVDWEQVLIRSAIPATITFGLGFLLAVGVLGGKQTSGIRTYTEAEATEILSTQDLPTQISNLQDNQIKVLENQLANLDVDTMSDETDSLVLAFSQINTDNKFNEFFKIYLSTDYNKSATTVYQSIKNHLAEQFKSSDVSEEDSGYIIQQNFFTLWNGRSWAKDTASQTALAGNVMASVISGTTDNSRYYQVIVPATNTNRDFALLNFIVKADDKNKIIAVSYTGQIDNEDVEAYYKQLSDLLNSTTSENKKDYRNLPVFSTEDDVEEQKADTTSEAPDEAS